MGLAVVKRCFRQKNFFPPVFKTAAIDYPWRLPVFPKLGSLTPSNQSWRVPRHDVFSRE